jgi:hypothetical protein
LKDNSREPFQNPTQDLQGAIAPVRKLMLSMRKLMLSLGQNLWRVKEMKGKRARFSLGEQKKLQMH